MDGFNWERRQGEGEYRQIHGLNRMMKWLKTTGATVVVIIIAVGARLVRQVRNISEGWPRRSTNLLLIGGKYRRIE